jgi:hypothetical protein
MHCFKHYCLTKLWIQPFYSACWKQQQVAPQQHLLHPPGLYHHIFNIQCILKCHILHHRFNSLNQCQACHHHHHQWLCLHLLRCFRQACLPCRRTIDLRYRPRRPSRWPLGSLPLLHHMQGHLSLRQRLAIPRGFVFIYDVDSIIFNLLFVSRPVNVDASTQFNTRSDQRIARNGAPGNCSTSPSQLVLLFIGTLMLLSHSAHNSWEHSACLMYDAYISLS